MGKQGRPTPAPIRKFIEDTCRNTPGLHNSQIVAMVVERFGEGARVDQSTVARFRRNLGLAGVTGPASATDLREDPGRWERHRALLLAPLTNLSGIEPLEVSNLDLMNLYLKLEASSWPVPKGRVWRGVHGELTLHLRYEHDCEISCEDDAASICLNQHLEGHPLAKAIAEVRRCIPQDLSDRMKLLDAIQDKANRPVEEGGTGLRLIPDLKNSEDGSRTGYGPYYLFTILRQGMSKALKLRLEPKKKEEFRQEPPGTIELGGHPVIQDADPAVWNRAVDWLLATQYQAAEWPETLRAAQSYTEAKGSCNNVQRQLDVLKLQAGLPDGSRCKICRDWAGN